jgi:hypothetical protein
MVEDWVRKPGASTYKRFAHDFTNNGATWNNFINAKDDGVTTAGTLSWYAVAIDGAGAKTKSTVRTLKIVRCDTEASIDGGILYPSMVMADYYDVQHITWIFTIADMDQLSQAKVTYSLRDPSGVPFLGGTITLTLVDGEWKGTSAGFVGGPHSYQLNTCVWSLTTTDRYGGKTSVSKTDTILIRYN